MLRCFDINIGGPKEKDEGGRMKDEVKAFKNEQHSFHPSSFILQKKDRAG
jgi:hypothetical protein